MPCDGDGDFERLFCLLVIAPLFWYVLPLTCESSYNALLGRLEKHGMRCLAELR